MVVSCEEGFEREAGGFGGGELAPGGGARSGSLRLELGIEGSGEGGLAVVLPVTPAIGVDLGGQFGIQEDDGGIGAPWAAEIDAIGALFGGDAAVVEDIATLLFGVVAALRGEHDDGVGERVDFAAIEE